MLLPDGENFNNLNFGDVHNKIRAERRIPPVFGPTAAILYRQGLITIEDKTLNNPSPRKQRAVFNRARDRERERV